MKSSIVFFEEEQFKVETKDELKIDNIKFENYTKIGFFTQQFKTTILHHGNIYHFFERKQSHENIEGVERTQTALVLNEV